MAKKNKILLYGGIVFIIYLIIALLITTQDLRAQHSEWTIETLKEYYDAQLRLRDNLVAQKFESLQIAVDKAEGFSREKFENTNEWRATLENLGRTYMPRSEYEADHESIIANINDLKVGLDKIENIKSGSASTVAYIIAGIGVLIAIASFIIKLK